MTSYFCTNCKKGIDNPSNGLIFHTCPHCGCDNLLYRRGDYVEAIRSWLMLDENYEKGYNVGYFEGLEKASARANR